MVRCYDPADPIAVPLSRGTVDDKGDERVSASLECVAAFPVYNVTPVVRHTFSEDPLH